MEKIAINGTTRGDLGKKATKAVRNAGDIPCVLHGTDETIHFSVVTSSVKNLVYSAEFKLAEIDIDGKTHSAILKEIQYHPVSEAILHIDFLRLEENRPLKVEVPVHFTGNSPGVRLGGKLQQNLRRVKIKTSLQNLVDHLSVDISKLELGQSVRVRDIKADEGVEIMSSPGIPVATIEIPRALRSAATAAAKGA